MLRIVAVVLCAVLAGYRSEAGMKSETLLQGALPVWHKGHAEEMNEQLVFSGVFEWREGAKPVLKLTSSNPYRVKLNGKFVWYGPARGPKGFFRLDDIQLDAKPGSNEIEIECAGYNCASFYFQKQPSFLVASVECAGKQLLKTSAGSGKGVFAAKPSSRVKKVSRYSHARTFGEAYVLPVTDSAALELEEFAPPALLKRIAAPPDFSVADDFMPVAAGKCVYDTKRETRKIGFVDTAGTQAVSGYPKAELVYDLWDAQQRFVHDSGKAPTKAAEYPLKGGAYTRFEGPVNRTGFPALTVKCLEPGELHVLFDECPVAGEFKPWRSVVANDVVWKFEKPGVYEVEAFEPYVLKAIETVAKSGSFVVSSPRLRLYRNAESRRVSFRSSDAGLDLLFAAAEENFAQNAVDGFMDCPGRERAGWNCDAYFTGRASALLSGNVSQESLFLENFAKPPHFDNIDCGMIPMCYPADSASGNYIPSWAMFFVLELDEYARLRGGDKALVDALKPRVFALVDFLSRYKNSDGLLEKLPRWVFVEWSAANKFVQDINYPNNMLWAATLEAVDRLYGRPDLALEAAQMKEVIRKQSWTGEWFRDNAIRRADGTLELTDNCSETCQYYAFYFGTATKELYPELYRRLIDEFGPDRAERGRYPQIHASAPFIGNFLRVDWLGQLGMARKVLEETRGYFLFMAQRTGTLWENVNSADNGSCCHGFASHVAVFLLRDILGLKHIDRVAKTICFTPPEDLPLDFCEATLPAGDEIVTLRWRRENGNVTTTTDLPDGWRSVPGAPVLHNE